MREALRRYLAEALAAAALPPAEAVEVGEEIAGHLEALEADAGGWPRKSEEEVFIMIETDFGDAREIGGSIGAARRPRGADWRRRLRKTAACLAVAVLIALVVRSTALAAYKVSGRCMEPVVPYGSHVLVNKLAYWSHAPAAGDIVVFDDGHVTIIGRVKGPGSRPGTVVVERPIAPESGMAPSAAGVAGEASLREVDAHAIVGRVCLQTR